MDEIVDGMSGNGHLISSYTGIFEKMKGYDKKTVIIISTVIFAVIHMNPNQILRALFDGYILGNEYSKNRKLFNVIIFICFGIFLWC